MLAPEDAVAAAAAYRVEVTVPVVGLLAEAGVGVLAAGQPSQRLPPVQQGARWSGKPLQGMPAGDGGQSGPAARGKDFDSRLAGNPRPFQSVRAAGLGGLPC